MLGSSVLSFFVTLLPLVPSFVFAGYGHEHHGRPGRPGRPGHHGHHDHGPPDGHYTYLLSDEYIGGGFLEGFEHETIKDPTEGRVKYVDEQTALANGLTYATWNSFVIRADDKHVVGANDTGRMSVRIRSRKTYTNHVIVADIKHIPEGCATWPSFWETNEATWPNDGEVDIIEGVDDLDPNKMALHTTAGCTMPPNRTMLGTSIQDDCDYTVNWNAGCSVNAKDKSRSYGPEFNAVGGGWYAMVRTNESIRVFFWSREDGSVPPDVAWGLPFVDPARWGIPIAYFPNTSCNFEKYFGEHNIIINLTLCGSWAGAVDIYTDKAKCPGNCTEYVNNNPEAFKNAYWEFAAVRVYE